MTSSEASGNFSYRGQDVWGELTSPTVMELYYQETGNDTIRAERGTYTKE